MSILRYFLVFLRLNGNNKYNCNFIRLKGLEEVSLSYLVPTGKWKALMEQNGRTVPPDLFRGTGVFAVTVLEISRNLLCNLP